MHTLIYHCKNIILCVKLVIRSIFSTAGENVIEIAFNITVKEMCDIKDIKCELHLYNVNCSCIPLCFVQFTNTNPFIIKKYNILYY